MLAANGLAVKRSTMAPWPESALADSAPELVTMCLAPSLPTAEPPLPRRPRSLEGDPREVMLLRLPPWLPSAVEAVVIDDQPEVLRNPRLEVEDLPLADGTLLRPAVGEQEDGDEG